MAWLDKVSIFRPSPAVPPLGARRPVQLSGGVASAVLKKANNKPGTYSLENIVRPAKSDYRVAQENGRLVVYDLGPTGNNFK